MPEFEIEVGSMNVLSHKNQTLMKVLRIITHKTQTNLICAEFENMLAQLTLRFAQKSYQS